MAPSDRLSTGLPPPSALPHRLGQPKALPTHQPWWGGPRAGNCCHKWSLLPVRPGVGLKCRSFLQGRVKQQLCSVPLLWVICDSSLGSMRAAAFPEAQ